VKVVDLHPEELNDKHSAGRLTHAERARLDAHLASCATCRFEQQVRRDFAAELLDGEEDAGVPSQVLLAIASGKQTSTRRR